MIRGEACSSSARAVGTEVKRTLGGRPVGTAAGKESVRSWRCPLEMPRALGALPKGNEVLVRSRVKSRT